MEVYLQDPKKVGRPCATASVVACECDCAHCNGSSMRCKAWGASAQGRLCCVRTPPAGVCRLGTSKLHVCGARGACLDLLWRRMALCTCSSQRLVSRFSGCCHSAQSAAQANDVGALCAVHARHQDGVRWPEEAGRPRRPYLVPQEPGLDMARWNLTGAVCFPVPWT